jgi:hypothetical protein
MMSRTALSAFDVGELLCDLPVADAEDVDAAYMPRTPGSIDPVVAPPYYGAVAGDDQFLVSKVRSSRPGKTAT